MFNPCSIRRTTIPLAVVNSLPRPRPRAASKDSRLRSRWSSPCATRCGSLPFARRVLRLHIRSVAFAPRGRGGAAYDWPCPNPMRATMKTMEAPSSLRRTRPPYARRLLRARSQCSRWTLGRVHDHRPCVGTRSRGVPRFRSKVGLQPFGLLASRPLPPV